MKITENKQGWIKEHQLSELIGPAAEILVMNRKGEDKGVDPKVKLFRLEEQNPQIFRWIGPSSI